jgi:PAS domain-containing protein
MNSSSDHTQRHATLRSLAVARLTGTGAPTRVRADASDALRVLFELASSPSTAASALALLHELQVHQVEVDLQDEELSRSRIELETSLKRQLDLYEFAPVGYVTIDQHTTLRELNHAAAALLDLEHGVLLGRALDGCLTSDSAQTLRAMLERLSAGCLREFADLELQGPAGRRRCVHASAGLDPAGGGYLVALMEVAGVPPHSALPER